MAKKTPQRQPDEQPTEPTEKELERFQWGAGDFEFTDPPKKAETDDDSEEE